MDTRARILKEGKEKRGPVAYWMSRDQRAQDNWALLYAQHLAMERQVPLLVVFCLAPQFLGATQRQYDFMLTGLEEVARELDNLKIPFHVLKGAPGKEIPRWVKALDVGLLVTDFDPLRIKRQWKETAARGLTVPLIEADAHNIIPCWLASPKQEWAAYTFRPKVHRALPEFLMPFPPLLPHPFPAEKPGTGLVATKLLDSLSLNESVPPVTWLRPGETAAKEQLRRFVA